MRFGLRRALIVAGCAVGLLLLCVGVAWLRLLGNGDAPSKKSGRPAHGRIEHAWSMPPSGDGFQSYSYLGTALGRQYVHRAVSETLQQGFARAAAQQPGRIFQLAETGWRRGTRFRPHHTHQNGLSVDILMPVQDQTGQPSQLSTWPWRLFGYGWEFDATGRSGTLHIDFESLATLLLALDAAATEHALRIELIIVTPEYIPLLLATPSGRKLSSLSGRFMRHAAWIRHDEHVHVDFALSGDRERD